MSLLHLSGILSTPDIFKIVLITFLFNNNSVREVILTAITIQRRYTKRLRNLCRYDRPLHHCFLSKKKPSSIGKSIQILLPDGLRIKRGKQLKTALNNSLADNSHTLLNGWTSKWRKTNIDTDKYYILCVTKPIIYCNAIIILSVNFSR